MFFHSATVAELFLTIERTTYTIRRVRDTALEPLAAPSLEEPAVLFLRRPAGFESDRFLFLPKLLAPLPPPPPPEAPRGAAAREKEPCVLVARWRKLDLHSETTNEDSTPAL